IPWEVPAHTPSAKQPEAAYSARQGQSVPVAGAPTAWAQVVESNTATSAKSSTVSEMPLRAETDEPLITTDAAAAQDDDTDRPVVAWASSGSSPHSPARSAKREPSLVSWRNSDWDEQRDSDEPRLSWSDLDQQSNDPASPDV